MYIAPNFGHEILIYAKLIHTPTPVDSYIHGVRTVGYKGGGPALWGYLLVASAKLRHLGYSVGRAQ